MVHTGYDPGLVALSVVTAVFASYAALDLGARLRRPDTGPSWACRPRSAGGSTCRRPRAQDPDTRSGGDPQRDAPQDGMRAAPEAHLFETDLQRGHGCSVAAERVKAAAICRPTVKMSRTRCLPEDAQQPERSQ
ncbi:MHYT domain-containing protein [Methylobacterium sp. NMS14P]|uniref:MHYT domain-containing protein n=1 Tax=Methylobacterium sp. NMS14P TaxID=2894310 RepID=UPI003FD3178D